MNISDALNKLRSFYANNDRLPSLKEIADLLDYSSRNSAVYLVNKLIELNFIRRGLNGKLISTDLFHQKIKFLGSVTAGFPTPEEEELKQSLSLDEFLISKPQATFMLEVKGDSMINAGIMPKDFVLVEKGKTVHSGDIVIAQVDGEWTMKYYRKVGKNIFLEAANPKYPPIYPKQELTIAGIVVSVCRKY
ncbi:MAG: repressor LexA [Candidatus Margulisbacteria bacterium GWF2_35_9]|nr:MAG: repressor LexA [Candidatus Margulisbacteria bacterium GWF2_35_9]